MKYQGNEKELLNELRAGLSSICVYVGDNYHIETGDRDVRITSRSGMFGKSVFDFVDVVIRTLGAQYDENTHLYYYIKDNVLHVWAILY